MSDDKRRRRRIQGGWALSSESHHHHGGAISNSKTQTTRADDPHTIGQSDTTGQGQSTMSTNQAAHQQNKFTFKDHRQVCSTYVI